MTPTLTHQLPTRTIHDTLTTSTQIIYGPFRIPSVALGAQAVNRSSTAAVAFLVWDILITFDDEVKYVWPRPWNYTKCVYFFVRYVPLMVEASLFCIGTEITPLFNFTPHDCFIWQVYQATAVTLIIVAVDTILILKVCALFANSPVVYIIKFGFVVEIVGMIIGLVLAVPKIKYDDVCLVTHAPKSFALWLTSLFFQALLFSLTAYRFYYTMRAGWGDVPLMTLLMRDGTWAFLLLFLVYLGYAILLVIPHHFFSGILYCWLVAAFSFSGYRTILNLLTFGLTRVSRSSDLPSHHTRRVSIDVQFTSHHLSSEPSNSYQLNNFPSTFTARTAGQTPGLPTIPELQLEA